MEVTCSRCHQTVQDGYCYCPNCGLPQLVFSADNSADAGQGERWGEAVRDANTVDWNSALRSTLPLAIPAGILCSMLSPVSILGLFLMGATAAWVVALYIRSHQPAWITVGAGARIGFVTGVVGSGSAAAMSGLSLYAMRYWLHRGSAFDDFWQSVVNMQQAQGVAVGADPQNLAAAKALMMSPEGRAGLMLFTIAVLMTTLVLFAVAGGALGARILTRARRREN
ncbi:MAG TPA: hypothetical protein VJX73_12505 [Terracidiphilus sp.]|nr:hypothetical protein [Terracidiphilus sp.]